MKHAFQATCALKSSTHGRTGNRFSAKGSLATFPTRTTDPVHIDGTSGTENGALRLSSLSKQKLVIRDQKFQLKFVSYFIR